MDKDEQGKWKLSGIVKCFMECQVYTERCSLTNASLGYEFNKILILNDFMYFQYIFCI